MKNEIPKVQKGIILDLKEYFKIMENLLIHCLTVSYMRSLPLSCLDTKYEATMSRLLAWLRTKTESWKQLA